MNHLPPPSPSPSLLQQSARGNPTLITGCRLVISAERKSLWGDLWMVGECFVFNGVLDASGQTCWSHHTQEFPLPLTDSDPSKRITLLFGAPYFDRRGVVVFEALHATFNEPAREHLQRILAHSNGERGTL